MVIGMREKLIELIKLSPNCICDLCGEKGRLDEVAEIIAANLIANGVTIRKWIPVTERLPKANKLVLCWWQSGDGEREHYGFATYQHHGVWYVSNEGMPEVTHWMPLPEPPNGERRTDDGETG